MEHETFLGLPVIGSGISYLPNVTSILFCTWDGAVYRVSQLEPVNHVRKDFASIDKGSPGVFGVAKNGNVIVSIAYYNGTGDVRDGIESEPHFVIENATSTITAYR